jgi:3-phenylpropionate/trans-cinnamate dioxygenase ferredoxin component
VARWVRVAGTEEIEPGDALRVEVGELAIGVFNVGGRYYAIDDTCSHEESSLTSDGYVEGEVVECTRHGARFDLATGRALSMPAVRGIATYPVRVDGTDVLVEVEGT